MKLQRLFADDDAVSPVIGVILMVAITVILAAVIGAFVLGIGNDPAAAPQATWDTNEVQNDSGFVQNTTFEVTGVGGEAPQTNDLRISVAGEENSSLGDETLGVGDTIDAGFARTNSDGTDDIDSGENVRIVWSDGGSEQIISEHRLSGDTTGELNSAQVNP